MYRNRKVINGFLGWEFASLQYAMNCQAVCDVCSVKEVIAHSSENHVCKCQSLARNRKEEAFCSI